MKKVLCFISCCKAKEASGKIMQPSSALSPADLPLNWQRLQVGRQRMAVHISTNTPPTSAVELYKGSFYQALGDIKDKVCQWHSLSNHRLIIISAGYGLLDASEPAHKYDIKMSGKIAGTWREFGLVEIIAELILKEQAEKVFGFFAGSTTWNHAGSKYRFFFTEGLRLARANGYRPTLAGCYYRKTGKGVVAILRALGSAFGELYGNEFDPGFCARTEALGRSYGNIEIGFDRLV